MRCQSKRSAQAVVGGGLPRIEPREVVDQLDHALGQRGVAVEQADVVPSSSGMPGKAMRMARIGRRLKT